MKSAKSNSRLAGVLQRRMMEAGQYASAPGLELGTITGTMGLKLDSEQYEIPRSDYMICRALAISNLSVSTGSAGDPSHKHTVNIPLSNVMPPLSAGMRVLVAWASGQPVIVDVVI